MILLSTLAFGADSRAPGHPDPLPERVGCERFEGTASGNDPTVRVVLLVCPNGEDLTGELQWSSLRSGWNVRKLQGRREGDSYRLSDVEILESKPRPGWRFCTIEDYRLTAGDGRLDGTYSSTSCDDDATLRLVSMGSAPPPSHKDQPDATETGSSRKSWLCVVSSAAPTSWMAGLLLVARRSGLKGNTRPPR